MSDLKIIDRPASVGVLGRRTQPVQLLVIYNDPRPAATAFPAYNTDPATITPHYYIASDGIVVGLATDDQMTQHGGTTTWQGQNLEIATISLAIALEHTPGTPFPATLLRSLHSLVTALITYHRLPTTALYRWEAREPGAESGPGQLVAVTLPVVPPNTPANALLDLGGSGLDDGDTTCAPPPLPPPQDSGAVLGDDPNRPSPTDLWFFLQQETYRHRGEGFRQDWAIHLAACTTGLGAPLAPSQSIKLDGRDYLFQVYGNDVLFNEKPNWQALQRLSQTHGGTIAASGLARNLLDTAYAASGAPFQADWKFHQIAVRENLGTPLSPAYRIPHEGKEYSLQIFSGETFYTEVPNWGDVRRLSQTPPGPLADALWSETYKPSGATYDPAAPFQQIAAQNYLGAPLTGPYQALINSASYTIQVFANDTVYSGFDEAPARLSALAPPSGINSPTPIGVATNTNAPSGSPDDAFSDQLPLFTMLPLPGQPPISQFYGYTRFSAGAGRQFYGSTQGRHSGIDFGVPVGTPLLAIGHGLVVHAGENGPFGAKLPQSIVVRYGAIYALYGHASVCHVAKGQFVTPGQTIGEVGSFNGPHLHFELRAVPTDTLDNRDPLQNAKNPGQAFNPIDCFSPSLDDYFARMLSRLGSTDGAFCQGGFRDQQQIVFGGPVDTRPCS
jgi:murein DD-endopeptidase MepM/ murein hydrolase activator NlpD